ncbi:acyl-CoA dehydrogenase [Halobacteriales archaeon QS_3_64_16]|nr:MAG: acyl-CoA dehydrogenase [Halobacteriales archaeon QS_3_64_16]
MSLDLTDEQREFRADVRAFANEEIAPVAGELDRNEQYPEEILAALGKERLTGITLSEGHGGLGKGHVELAILIEELSAELMPVASALALNLGVATVLERFGSEELRRKFLPGMARFETIGALGLSEGEAGSDKRAMVTTAEKQGEEWILDGHKQWVTNFLDADVVLTYARTGASGEESGREGGDGGGISAFLVPADAFEVEEVWDTLGARSVKSPRVSLTDVRVPADRLVGTEGQALAERGRLDTGVNLPARGVGIARAALEDTVAYGSEREQFGQSIGDFQGVGWTIGEMATRVDTARLLTLRAAKCADREADTARELSMAKIHATEAAVANANDAMQIHGGIGYTTEHDIERYLRDARLLTIAGGPNELHRNTLAETVLSN